MWEERESLLTTRNHNQAPSAKSNRKSNITLAIDSGIQKVLKNIAEAEGLSVNAKINSIL